MTMNPMRPSVLVHAANVNTAGALHTRVEEYHLSSYR